MARTRTNTFTNSSPKDNQEWGIRAQLKGRIVLQQFLKENPTAHKSNPLHSPYDQLKNIVDDDKKLIQVASKLIGIKPEELTAKQIALLRNLKTENQLNKEERIATVDIRTEVLVNEYEEIDEALNEEKRLKLQFNESKGEPIEEVELKSETTKVAAAKSKARAEIKRQENKALAEQSMIDALIKKILSGSHQDLDLLTLLYNPDNRDGIGILFENFKKDPSNNSNVPEVALDGFIRKLSEFYTHFKDRFKSNNLTSKDNLPYDVLFEHVKYDGLFQDKLFIEGHKRITTPKVKESKESVKMEAKEAKEAKWEYVKPRTALKSILPPVGAIKSKEDYLKKINKLGILPTAQYKKLSITQANLLDRLFAEFIYNDIVSNLRLNLRGVTKADAEAKSVTKKVLQGNPRPTLLLLFEISKNPQNSSQKSVLVTLAGRHKIIPMLEDSANSLLGSLGNAYLSKKELQQKLNEWNLSYTPDLLNTLYTENQYIWLKKLVSDDAELLKIVQENKSSIENIISKTNSHEEFVDIFNTENKVSSQVIKNFNSAQMITVNSLIKIFEENNDIESKAEIKQGLDLLFTKDELDLRPQLKNLLSHTKDTQLDNLVNDEEIRNRKQNPLAKYLKFVYSNLNEFGGVVSPNKTEAQKVMKYFGIKDVNNGYYKALLAENKIINIIDDAVKVKAKLQNIDPNKINKLEVKKEILSLNRDQLVAYGIATVGNIDAIYGQIQLYKAYNLASTQAKVDIIAANETTLLQAFERNRVPENEIAQAVTQLLNTGKANAFQVEEKKDEVNQAEVISKPVSPKSQVNFLQVPKPIVEEEQKAEFEHKLDVIEDYIKSNNAFTAETIFPALNKEFLQYPYLTNVINEILATQKPDQLLKFDNKVQFYKNFKNWIDQVKPDGIKQKKSDQLELTLNLAFNNLGIKITPDNYKDIYGLILTKKAIERNMDLINDRIEVHAGMTQFAIDPVKKEEILNHLIVNVKSEIDGKNLTAIKLKDSIESKINEYLFFNNLLVPNPSPTNYKIVSPSAQSSPSLTTSISPPAENKTITDAVIPSSPAKTAAELEKIAKYTKLHNEFHEAIQDLNVKKIPAHLKMVMKTIIEDATQFSGSLKDIDVDPTPFTTALHHVKNIAEKPEKIAEIDALRILAITLRKDVSVNKKLGASITMFVNEAHKYNLKASLQVKTTKVDKQAAPPVKQNVVARIENKFDSAIAGMMEYITKSLSFVESDKTVRDSLHTFTTSRVGGLFTNPAANIKVPINTDVAALQQTVIQLQNDISSGQIALPTYVKRTAPMDQVTLRQNYPAQAKPQQSFKLEASMTSGKGKTLSAGQSAVNILDVPNIVKSTYTETLSQDGKGYYIMGGNVMLNQNRKHQMVNGEIIPANGYLLDAESMVRAFITESGSNQKLYIRKPGNNTPADELRVEAAMLVLAAMGWQEGKHFVNQSGHEFIPSKNAVNYVKNVISKNATLSDELNNLAKKLEPAKDINAVKDVINTIKDNRTPSPKQFSQLVQELGDKLADENTQKKSLFQRIFRR